MCIYVSLHNIYIIYDHRTLKARLPVRSAIFKQCTGGLVVRWETTSESPLLYVFPSQFFLNLFYSNKDRDS